MKTCNVGENRQVLTLARLSVSNSFDDHNILRITTMLASLTDSFDIWIDISLEMMLKSFLGSMAAMAQYNFWANDQHRLQSLTQDQST